MLHTLGAMRAILVKLEQVGRQRGPTRWPTVFDSDSPGTGEREDTLLRVGGAHTAIPPHTYEASAHLAYDVPEAIGPTPI